jgi:sigma-B regulation protein RsbU (phosphoserine phosphatase)
MTSRPLKASSDPFVLFPVDLAANGATGLYWLGIAAVSAADSKPAGETPALPGGGNMATTQFDSVLHEQLLSRKQRLEKAITASPDRPNLTHLLDEVDKALARMNDGSYGLCEVCHEPIERERLAADPLSRLCLDHLTALQQRLLEQDLELASRIQSALLPRSRLVHGGWRAAFHYQPLGLVSGDYCDLIPAEDGSVYFMLGDVSGKGVAASMLMAHLNATMRVLTGLGLRLVEIVERANRLFCESTLSSHFATLVCGRAAKNGKIEICNAGHLPPLLGRASDVSAINATGLPLGLFCSEEFSMETLQLGKNDLLLLYTDGLSEAENSQGEEFGMQRLVEIVRSRHSQTAEEIVHSCVSRLFDFRSGIPARDDLTIMAIERTESGNHE